MVEHKDEKFIFYKEVWYKVTCKKLKNDKVEQSIRLEDKKHVLTEKELKDNVVEYRKGKYN